MVPPRRGSHRHADPRAGAGGATSRVRESLARIRTAGPDLLTAHWGGGVKDLEGVLPTLVDAGAFSKPSVISHGNRMVDGELAALVRGGIGLASTPDTEMGMIGDPLTTSDVLARGIHLAVGIDTTCYVGADLFAVTRGLMLEMRRQRVEFTARQGLELLTVGAANAVGEAANLGTLTPGKRGDLVVVRPDPARARSRRCCSTAGRAMSIPC